MEARDGTEKPTPVSSIANKRRSQRYNEFLPDLHCCALMSTQPVPSQDETLCFCSGTTRGDIQRLFEQGMDLQAISQWTGALTGCGGCEWDIEVFLKELAQQKGEQGV